MTMRVASSGYGVAGERRFSNESVERLAKHELFDFQVQQSAVSVRVSELHDLVLNGRNEPDLPDLLDEFVHELEDDIMAAGGTEMFLLAALQHFRQSMEMYLEMDMDARMAQSGAVKNIFASDKSSKKSGSKSPMRARPVLDLPQTPTRSPGRKNSGAQRQHTKKAGASDDDIVCAVCFQADSLEHDPIVICDLCNVAVHQSCYRIEDLPENDWFCRPCQVYLRAKDVSSNVLPTYELQCVACLTKGGAFIGTVDNEWVHMACSMFLPQLYVDSSHRYDGEEVINGIDQLKERRTLRCCYCKKKERGACAQCVVGKCATSYHVLCALKHNLKFVFMDETGQFGSGCSRHQAKFLGLDQQQASTTPAEEPRTQMTQRPSSAPVTQQKHESKATKKIPRRRNSMPSESSDDADGDGILLDEESDNSSMFLSDVESDINSPQRVKVKSPAREIDLTKAEASPRPHRAASPGKLKSPGRVRTAKKQQTLMVPAFGIVKQLQKPAPAASPSASVQAPLHPPAPAPIQPVAPAGATGSIPRPPMTKLKVPTTLRTTKTQLFVPFTGMVIENGVFEEMLVEIPILPLGISIRTEVRPHGNSMVIQGPLSHSNLMVSDAIRKGVLQEGDEIISVNDVPMRGRDVGVLKELLAGMQPPFRVWLRLKSKRSLANFCKINGGSDTGALSAPSTPAPLATTPSKPPLVPVSDSKAKQTQLTFETPSKPAADVQKQASEKTTERTPMEEATAADWPWFYLRSDGKLAMNLMWKSLDAGFFVSKFDRATWENLLGKVEAHLGFRLDKTHPEYVSTTADLLVVPSREFAVPQYIQEFRRTKSQKKRNLANDSVFMGVNMEQVSQEDEWDNLPALAVGTTVHVAKRTWPGINKLGGAGRVKKVHEETSPDGEKKRFVYDIAYILGGSEKKVERKWIAVVKDFNTAPENASEEDESMKPIAEEKAKAEDKEPESLRLRFGMRLEVLDQDASLPAVTRSTERKVHLQISVLTNSVSLERDVVKESGDSAASKREMLWHQHFPVKQSGLDALISDSVGASVEYMEEVGEDEGPDAEEEESEVTKQLLQAQEQFRLVMERNDELFSALKLAVDGEYATKAYRKRQFKEIQWKHYEAMYREIDAAREAFDNSDDSEGDDPMTGDATQRPRSKSGERKRDCDKDGLDSDSDQDDSCGGMFINKIKQEGNEVCVLCELTGGDFAATSCGRVVHPQCAMYTPETFFKDGVAHGIDKIQAEERRALTCSVCGRKNGLSKIQCANQRCMTAFHVACAYVNGLLTRDPHYQAWCPKHLKTSGMQGEIEWPPHMRKNRVQVKDTPAKSSRRGSSGGSTISSAKSNSKRKRGRSNTADSTTGPSQKGKKAPATSVIHIDDDDDEPNCARRLVIDDVSDDEVVLVHDPKIVFKKGDTVRVDARDGPGMNKQGGVGRVIQVNETTSATGDKVVTYDVAYILDNAKEKQVEAQYVKPYLVDTPSSHTSDDGPKKKRSRAAAAPVQT